MGSLPEVSAKMLDLVREHGRLTIGDAERLTGENRNTLKQHFRVFVNAGHLALNGAGRDTWYAPKLKLVNYFSALRLFL